MAKTINFDKYQGLGNDFVLIDGRKDSIRLNEKIIRHIADRRYGVGCDQLMIVRRSKKADFRMELYNSDGSAAEMCGNGIRCFARFVMEKKISGKKKLEIETLAGIIKTTMRSARMVEVDMGEPILDGPKVPVNLEGKVVNRGIQTQAGPFQITTVSMGNPHMVIFKDNLDSIDLDKVGPILEHHNLFPKRTNVHFAKVESRKKIVARHWERGAGATLACGTGACATAVAAVLNGLTDREIEVSQRGGEMKIRWDEKDNRVYMTGPADEVFTGRISI
jgi:diaminopimelate epimerase